MSSENALNGVRGALNINALTILWLNDNSEFV
jgi:hypothetical protein